MLHVLQLVVDLVLVLNLVGDLTWYFLMTSFLGYFGVSFFENKLGEVTMMTEGRSMSDKGEEGAVYTLMALVTLASHFLPLRLNLDRGETCKRASDVVFGAGLYWVHRDWMRWPPVHKETCKRT